MNTKPEGAELNIAVIGCGRWGKNHVRVASERYGERLRWICDTDEGRAKALPNALASRFTTNIVDVLDDATVSAVIIATPAETHYALAHKALEIPGERPRAHPRLLATSLQGAPSRGHRR